MRRPAKVAIAVCAAVVAIAVFLWLVVTRTSAAKDYIAGRIASVREQGLALDFEDLGISLVGPSVTVNGLVVRTQPEPEFPPLLSAKTVRLNLNMGALLRGNFALDEAVLEDPQVYAVITERGGSNLPGARSGGGGQAAMPAIPRLRATNGSFRLDDRRDGVSIHLPKWRLSVEPDSGIEFQSSEPGSVTYRKRQIAVDEINLATRIRAGAVEIDRLEVKTPESSIRASGTAGTMNWPTVNLRGFVTLDLPELTRIAGMPPAGSGELKGTFTATGPLDQLRLRTVLHGNDIPATGFESPTVNADFTYQRQRGRIDVHSIAVNAPVADFTAEGAVALHRTGASALQGRIGRIDLRQLTAGLKAPYILASHGAGTAQARWPGLAFKQASGSAGLQLTALLPSAAPNVLPASGPLSVAVQSGRIRVSLGGLDALSARWNGNVAVDFQKLGGTVRGQTSDAGRMLPQLQAFLGRKQPLVPVNVRGAASFVVNLGGTTQRPTAGLTVNAPALNVGRFDNVALNARAQYTPAQLRVQQANLRWRGQTLTVQGNVGLQSDAAPLDLTAYAEGATSAALLGANVPQMPAVPSFPPIPSIPGLSQQIPQLPRFALRAHVGGTTAAPRVTFIGPAANGNGR
ncbi:MAG TPA: hypothetical protein PKW45_19285 [Bryobacteraceae bacterium]|nr:hypothetical protein [Bryobacteraceae bacterium]